MNHGNDGREEEMIDELKGKIDELEGRIRSLRGYL